MPTPTVNTDSFERLVERLDVEPVPADETRMLTVFLPDGRQFDLYEVLYAALEAIQLPGADVYRPDTERLETNDSTEPS